MINTVIFDKSCNTAHIISGENVVCAVHCDNYTQEKLENGSIITILRIRNEICPVINADLIEVQSDIERNDVLVKVVGMAWRCKHDI